MKKSVSIIIASILLTGISLVASGAVNQAVGAPVDGGLLTVLGAAGVAYYAARKKKANKQE